MDKSQKDIGLKVIPFTAQFAWINSGAENEESGITMEQREKNQQKIYEENKDWYRLPISSLPGLLTDND